MYVIGIPLLLLILLCVNHRRGTLDLPAIEFDDNGMIRPAQVNTAVQRLDEYFSNRIAFASLYDQYEAAFYWFEFGCTMRKMILTGALVLFGAGTTPQVVTALAVCIFWFGIIANLNPFEDEIDDRLAQVEAIQILFTLLIGLVLQLQATSEEGTDGEEDALGIVLIVLNLAVIALAFVQQPIFLKIASRVSEVAVCTKERAASLCGKTEDLNVAAGDAAVTGIEMRNNPSANRTGGGAAEAATKIEIRGYARRLDAVGAPGAAATDDAPRGDDALPGLALQVGEPHTVANLAALQERDAEIAKLKEEIAALRMQPRGDVVDLVVAADASAAAAASASRGTVLDSAGITEAAAAATASSFHSHFETMFNAFNAANGEDDQLEDEDGASEQDAVEAAEVAASSSALSAAASSGTSCTL